MVASARRPQLSRCQSIVCEQETRLSCISVSLKIPSTSDPVCVWFFVKVVQKPLAMCCEYLWPPEVLVQRARNHTITLQKCRGDTIEDSRIDLWHKRFHMRGSTTPLATITRVQLVAIAPAMVVNRQRPHKFCKMLPKYTNIFCGTLSIEKNGVYTYISLPAPPIKNINVCFMDNRSKEEM